MSGHGNPAPSDGSAGLGSGARRVVNCTPLAFAMALPIVWAAVKHRRAVIALLQGRADLSQRIAHKSVRQYRLQTVAYLDAVLMILDREQQQDACVLPLLADAPFAEKVVRKRLNRISFQTVDGYERHLGSGGALYFAAVVVDARTHLVVEYVREIADVALRLQRIDVKRE